MANAAQPPERWRRSFFTIWGGQAFSIVGSGLVHFALVWWLTVTTGSATVLAVGTLIGMLPGVLLGPFAGACVDRWDRRRVMILADGLIALASAVLALIALAGILRPWHIYVIMLVRSLGGVFHWPAMRASTSLMVPKEQLMRVGGMNESLNGILGIITPPLGALLMTLLPLYGILAIDVFTAMMAIGPLLFIGIPQPRRVGGLSQSRGITWLWDDVRAALGYVWRWPGLCWVMLMATLLNFFLTPAYSLMPLLVTKHFHGGVQQLGWISSVGGLGMVLGGLVLSIWGGFRRRYVTSMIGLIGIGLGTLITGLAPQTAFLLALMGTLLARLMNPIANGPLFAILQGSVEADMQGRVFMLLGSMSGAISPLAMAIAGPVSDSLGVRAWFLVGGAACVVFGIAGLMIPAIAQLEEGRQPDKVVAQPDLVTP